MRGCAPGTQACLLRTTLRNPMKHTSRGFTLIELLVVIAIIGILSSVVLVSLNTARAKARDAKRLSDLHQVELALNLYYSDNGAYPVAGAWWGNCATWGSHGTSGANGWVPNLAPTYIPELPLDPKPANGTAGCYIYSSNGTDYMLMDYTSVETYTVTTNKWMRPIQPTNPTTFSFYTPGAVNW